MGVTWKLSGFGDEISDVPAQQFTGLQAVGAHHVELRSAWGVNVVDLSTEQLDGLAGIMDVYEMKVSSIGSPIGKSLITQPADFDQQRLRRAIAAAHRLGAPYIRVFSFYPDGALTLQTMRDEVVERMGAFASIAASEGVTLLHENEKDIFGDIPSRCADILASVNSPALRAVWDAANFVQVGVAHPYDEGWELLSPYVEYLHVKDALSADGSVTPAGEGDGQVPQVIAALAARGFAGFASLEPHLGGAGDAVTQSGAFNFGRAARAFWTLATQAGVSLA